MSRLVAISRMLGIILFTLTALLHGVSSQYNPYRRPTSSPLVGQPCDLLPAGFRRNTCGPETIVGTEEQPALLFKYGPHVCQVNETIVVSELEYVYVEHCIWVFEYAYYAWIQRCQLVCIATRNCMTDRNITITRTTTRCCTGFSTRPAVDEEHQHYFYKNYYTSIQTVPVGCPVAIGDTLLECLQIHELTRFTEFLMFSSFFDLLNTTESEVTVFAPTTAAFDGQSTNVIDALVNSPDPGMTDNLIGFHIVNGTVRFNDIMKKTRFDNLADSLLHGTTIFQFTYNPYQSYGLAVEERFINGAEIVVKEACRTRGGTLHIIDRVLIPSNDTIAEILRNQSRFSNFTDLLDIVNLLEALENPSISRTVFAFTDDVLQAAFPPDLLSCLTTYMRRPLQNLLLFHMSGQVDYNSTIFRQLSLSTLLLKDIRVNTFPNGSVFLTDEMIEVIETDIEARTGVIHVIDGILLPPEFDFGKCQAFVPTTPPPTTAPPTTVPPTTGPPTTTPPTTEPPSPSPSPLLSIAPNPEPGSDFEGGRVFGDV